MGFWEGIVSLRADVSSLPTAFSGSTTRRTRLSLALLGIVLVSFNDKPAPLAVWFVPAMTEMDLFYVSLMLGRMDDVSINQ